MDFNSERALAESQVAGPSIGLIVTAILGMVGQLASVGVHVLGAGVGAMTAKNGPEGIAQMMSGGFGVFFSLIGLVVGVVILLGALKMKKLESYSFAMAAAIIAMVPCISPCCLVGLPIGIWALVVLNKPEVKSQFRA
jgi:hypothetical protein